MPASTLICADLSMRRPGFAVQQFDDATAQTSVLYKSNVDNKDAKKKCHGQILGEIAHELHTILKSYPGAILVREKALAVVSLSAKTIQVQHKVVGVSDLYAWAVGQRTWEEIMPTTIKTLLTGDKNADKAEVAAAQEHYVGHCDYACDDESDAVAVGIAWLIRQNKIKPWKE